MKCDGCGEELDLYRCRNPVCSKNPDGGTPFQKRDQADVLPGSGKPWSGLQGFTSEVKERQRKRRQEREKKRERLRKVEREKLDVLVSSWDGSWNPKDAKRKLRRN